LPSKHRSKANGKAALEESQPQETGEEEVQQAFARPKSQSEKDSQESGTQVSKPGRQHERGQEEKETKSRLESDETKISQIGRLIVSLTRPQSRSQSMSEETEIEWHRELIAKNRVLLEELESGNTAGGEVFPETQSEIERLKAQTAQSELIVAGFEKEHPDQA
jgi:hypothetical protein